MSACCSSSTRISQAAESLDLEWSHNDPVSLAFTVEGANWAGSYIAPIRSGRTEASPLLASLIATATFDGTDTAFTLVLADSTAVDPLGGNRPAGYWALKQVPGLTRLTGAVFVEDSVIP